jgi:signal transduction histidine kinase
MDTPCQTVSSIDYLVTQGYLDTMGASDQPEQPPAKDGGELGRLLEEQAALRRVATLVAEGAPPAEVFQAVSFEVAQLLHAEGAALTRFETDGTVTALGGWTSTGGYLHAGTRFALEGTVSGLVFESGQPARIDRYADAPGAALAAAREMGWRSSVGVPITVEGRLWGVLAAVSRSDQPPPPDTEQRLAEFTQLVATAIANTENREQLTRLAEEQAALRRVATLVAEGAPPAEVIEAVITEAGRVVPADAAGLSRYEADGTTALGSWSRTGGYVNVGARFPHERGTVGWLVYETGRPGRIGTYEGVPGDVSAAARQAGWRSSVGVPIVVEGRLWGVMTVASTTDQPLPLDTEERLAEFTELVATAIANAESRAELAASRARIVATADAARRRIERDLHDGAQQQLVSLALELRAAQAAAPPELDKHRAELSRAVDGVTSVLDLLREIARGIHPAILAEGGLGPALRTLSRRSPIPVQLDAHAEERLPEPVEVAAYYVVSEALTNSAKYARASNVQVSVDVREGSLWVAVRDDGLGGADPARGSGLLGLKDRVEAMGGSISLQSPHNQGTTLIAELPLGDRTL